MPYLPWKTKEQLKTPDQVPAQGSNGAGRRRRARRLRRIEIDFSNPRHRRFLLISALALFLLLSLGMTGAYKAYEYTESPEFCGGVCHPMAPEFERYEHSPHANVPCVKCHIGPGMSFFVRSKIDGIRQVFAVLTDSYSRPIKSPVHNLRPAREICEQCHTPASFKDNIIKNIIHYAPDEANTPIKSTFILKMGGWEESTGISQGIHWHITAPVYYIAADEQRQVILWVGVEQPDGTLKEYFARDMLTMANTDFVEEAMQEGRVRRMDCIDCHNRAAHLIPPPDVVVDQAINAGRISREIPYIRKKAVEVLTPAYENRAAGYAAIEALWDFYRQNYPDFVQRRGDLLQAAIEELKGIFDQTQYPDMHLSWDTNPNNARHTPFMGCFRCHDDKHAAVDADGNELELISVKCNLCHTVPIVGRGDEVLLEAPVITGATPESHSDFRWTIEHRSVSEQQVQEECYQCHGQRFCTNEACHNLDHPENMVYTHAEEYRYRGDEVCFTCHQNFVLCSRCHPGGIVENP